MRIPKDLKDIFLDDVPRGALFYPSREVLRSGRDGNYFLEDENRFTPDRETFPAVALDMEEGSSTSRRVLTPRGIRTMSVRSLVSTSSRR